MFHVEHKYLDINEISCTFMSEQIEGNNMFKLNNQPALFSFENELCKKQRDLLAGSKEKWFHHLIFRNIREQDFQPLFSEKASRPNVPINILVSALVLKELKGLSYDELMESILFDLRFKTALGLVSIEEVPFSRATLFNFQNRLGEYEQQTGVNLIELVFDGLTAEQIRQLSLKTDIQRTDSTMVSSNIRKYSRVQLLIEVLLRLGKKLSETDKQAIGEQLQAYLEKGSQKYVYALKSKDLPHELEKLGQVYYTVHNQIKENQRYQGSQELINFERVYREHFVVVEQEINPRPTEELHSGMLQSPDDPDATYRKKREQSGKGYVINATETGHPDNPIQLVTDIAVAPNNTDDSQVLNGRIDPIMEKTPELKEMHTDGGYGSEANDKKFEELGITQVTTAVRGRECEVDIVIAQTSQSPAGYLVKCPGQQVVSTPTKQRHKVRFDLAVCQGCPLKEKCPMVKNKGRSYFKHEDYLQNKRNSNILNIPAQRRKIRPNVEALMKEFKTRTNNGKTKVRGIFKTTLFAVNAGIAINFGRIYRYVAKKALTDGFDPSMPAALYAIMLKTIYLLQKSAIFVRHFFASWLCLEYFYSKGVLRLNMPAMRALN